MNFDPEMLMDGLSKELTDNLKDMSKVKTIEEKMQYSKIIKNLCESLGVFLSLASELMDTDFETDFDKLK